MKTLRTRIPLASFDDLFVCFFVRLRSFDTATALSSFKIAVDGSFVSGGGVASGFCAEVTLGSCCFWFEGFNEGRTEFD